MHCYELLLIYGSKDYPGDMEAAEDIKRKLKLIREQHRRNDRDFIILKWFLFKNQIINRMRIIKIINNFTIWNKNIVFFLTHFFTWMVKYLWTEPLKIRKRRNKEWSWNEKRVSRNYSAFQTRHRLFYKNSKIKLYS